MGETATRLRATISAHAGTPSSSVKRTNWAREDVHYPRSRACWPPSSSSPCPGAALSGRPAPGPPERI